MRKNQAAAELVAHGVNGDIEIGGGWLTIKREGAVAKLNRLREDKPLALRDITAVELEEPGRVTYGAIRFDFGAPHRRWWSPLRWWGLFSNARKQNSVMFRYEQADDFQAIRDRVESYVDVRASRAIRD
jgi:hypothetical protein